MNITSPPVLTFAGPSGHGKTELAAQMGALLKLPITVIDCAQMRSDWSLFGSRNGYQGSDLGLQLNNHLAVNSGVRNVDFIDNFDKKDQEVRNSLLLLLDSGLYHDRRTNTQVDAGKTIWILAINLDDRAVTKFYTDHLEGTTETQQLKISHKPLIAELRTLFRDHFRAPMSGCMENIAPYYPFCLQKQAVVGRKFFMKLSDEARKPIDLSGNVQRYTCHVHFAVKNDGLFFKHIAEESYVQDLGARSLSAGIDQIRCAFFISFSRNEGLVSEESNDGPLTKYMAQVSPIREDLGEVKVVRDGVTKYDRGQDGRSGTTKDDE